MQQRSMPHIQKGARADQERADRRGLQGPPELEPRRLDAVSPRAAGRRSPPGRLEGLPRQRPRPAVRRVPLPQLALVLGFRRRRAHRPDGPLDRRRPLVPRRRPSDQGHRDRQPFRQQGSLADARHDPVHPGIPEQRPGPLRGDVLQRQPGRDDHVHGDRRARCTSTAAGTSSRPSTARGSPSRGSWGAIPSKGADFYDKPDGELLHLTNWVECIRSRQRPNAPAEAGVSAAGAAHLGNRAYRSGQVAEWTSS